MATLGAVVVGILLTVSVWLLFTKPKASIPAGTKPLPGPKGMPYFIS
jgi:hypothetical protein